MSRNVTLRPPQTIVIVCAVKSGVEKERLSLVVTIEIDFLLGYQICKIKVRDNQEI